jgi:uncharacterized membrane protein YdjX (TVP38/TMEM64 family)
VGIFDHALRVAASGQNGHEIRPEIRHTQATMTGQRKKLLLLIAFITVIAALRYSPLGKALTFENLTQNRDQLVIFVRDHYGLSVAAFIAVYVLTTALSIPGAVILTLAGGFLFGVAAGTLYVNIGATAGATIAFLSARYLLGDRLQEKYGKQLAKFNRELDRNGANYLLTLRLIPAFPFFLINFLSGLTKLRLGTFLWTTSLGIIPGTIVFTFAGQQLGSIRSPADILSKNVIIAFLVLALFALIPAIVKRIRAGSKTSADDKTQ